MKRTLAIFSPNRNAYSETFIQAHKNLPFNIKYYYGGYFPEVLEPEKSIYQFSLVQRIRNRLNKNLDLNTTALLNSLRNEKVDCILAEYGPTACETFEIAKLAGIPMIVHFHGFDAVDRNTLKQYGERYKKMFEYVSKVVAVSKKMYEALISLGCRPEKLVINTYGPNPGYFNIHPDYLGQQLVALGRFVDKKAPYFTILAFKEVLESCPDARLVMGGDGELLNTCRNLARYLDVADRIEFKGVVDLAAICNLFQGSIAFVQHSITAESGDTEGAPVAVLEAQAAGLPVISTNHAGIPDVVVNNETGLLVNEYDVKGMAANMIRILKENGLASKMGKAAKLRIQTHFTMEKHLQVLESLVLQSVSGS